MPATRVVMEALPYIGFCWSVFEMFRNLINGFPNYPVVWAYATVGSFIFIFGAGLIYDMYKTYDKLDWRHCLKINDYYGGQQKAKKYALTSFPFIVLGMWLLFTGLFNGTFWRAMELTIFSYTVMYFSVFMIGPHNPNMLTLEQFEKFCEKNNYTVPEETSFMAKMSSTQSRLGTLHAKMLADIYGSKSSSSEMEMAEKTS